MSCRWHQVLGVEPDAAPDEVERASRALAQELHRQRVSGFGVAADEADRRMDLMRQARRALRAAPCGRRPDRSAWRTSQWRAGRAEVPDFFGLRFSVCFYEASLAGLRLDVVRLTPRPAPVDGVVVTQRPSPGTAVRRGATVTVEVWHPPA